jgi:hypothetical protein
MELGRRSAGAVVAGLGLVLGLGMPAAPGAQEPEVLRTGQGIPLKVVVRRDAAIYEEPRPDARTQPVATFQFFYAVTPMDAEGTPAPPGIRTRRGFYAVASSLQARNALLGWIRRDDVVEWPHRQALGFRGAADRDPALFYARPEEVAAALNDRADVRPISREPAGSQGVALMPILDESAVELASGDRVRVFKVAYLHGRGGGLPAITEQEVRAEMTLDVAFVIDATGSMQKWIDGVKQAVGRIAATVGRIPELAGRVRFALVCFRDSPADYLPTDHFPPPGTDFVAKTFCTLAQGSDHARFLEALGRVVAEGGGQQPERVLDGVKLAVAGLDWGRISYRQVILIGNASTHVDPAKSGGLTLEGVLALAQPPGGRQAARRAVTIHALQVESDDPRDAEVARDQFTALAGGRDYSGLYARLDEVDAFVTTLADLLRAKLNYIVELNRGTDLERILRSGRGDRHVGPLLINLQDAAAGAGEEPIGFTAGFVAEVDRRGNRLVEPYVLVRKGQLEQFVAILDALLVNLKNAGEPGGQDVRRVVQAMQTCAIHLNIGEAIGTETDLAKVLEWAAGLPVQNRIFAITPSRLAAMGASQFEAWMRDVQASRNVMKSQVENQDLWFSLLGKRVGGDAEASQNDHGFLKVTDLP